MYKNLLIENIILNNYVIPNDIMFKTWYTIKHFKVIPIIITDIKYNYDLPRNFIRMIDKPGRYLLVTFKHKIHPQIEKTVDTQYCILSEIFNDEFSASIYAISKIKSSLKSKSLPQPSHSIIKYYTEKYPEYII